VYCPHTALDAVWGGVNDWLADCVLGAKGVDGSRRGDVRGLKGELQTETEGAEGRLVVLNQPIPLQTLITRIKSFLGLPHGT
jgi:putative NIF3 family GTP cyclohydrolase 1 type 2